jgi:hypothetical protein
MMRKLMFPILAGAMIAGGANPPLAYAQQKRGDQESARKELHAGHVLPLRDIEAKVIPRMGDMTYLGPAYDEVAKAYRLKFIKDGKVMFVDVDARTGQVLAVSK